MRYLLALFFLIPSLALGAQPATIFPYPVTENNILNAVYCTDTGTSNAIYYGDYLDGYEPSTGSPGTDCVNAGYNSEGPLSFLSGETGIIYIISLDTGNNSCEGLTLADCRLNPDYSTEMSFSISASGLVSPGGMGEAIDDINNSFMDYFYVLINKLLPFIIGAIIIAMVWVFGRSAINNYR